MRRCKRIRTIRCPGSAAAIGLSAALLMGSLLFSMLSVKAEEDGDIQWLPQSGMSVSSNVAAAGGYGIEQILDGDVSTIWHSDWNGSGETLPVDAFTVDLGEATEYVSQIKYIPRQDDVNGKIKKYQVLAGESEDSMEVVAGGYWDFSETDKTDGSEKTAAFKSEHVL